MKTRIVVHIAFNRNDKRLAMLICAGGQLIPLRYGDLDEFSRRTASEWLNIEFCTFASLAYWKDYVKSRYKAVRFQRVTLIGESK